MATGLRADRIAAEVLGLIGSGRQVAPFSDRNDGFDLQEAYEVAARVRVARAGRGERVVGRKIGFTNTHIWEAYGVAGPIWNYVYDDTLREIDAADSFGLAGLPEPRIEPEIVLGLASEPRPGMTEAELGGCVGWIAHGLEIVVSVFPGWRFAPPDAAAACGLHAALILGPRHAVPGGIGPLAEALRSFEVGLFRCGERVETGCGANVLGGPLNALGFLVEELARHAASEPLRAGEIVSTGTLTDACPVAPGETWSTEIAGLPVGGLAVTFR